MPANQRRRRRETEDTVQAMIPETKAWTAFKPAVQRCTRNIASSLKRDYAVWPAAGWETAHGFSPFPLSWAWPKANGVRPATSLPLPFLAPPGSPKGNFGSILPGRLARGCPASCVLCKGRSPRFAVFFDRCADRACPGEAEGSAPHGHTQIPRSFSPRQRGCKRLGMTTERVAAVRVGRTTVPALPPPALLAPRPLRSSLRRLRCWCGALRPRSWGRGISAGGRCS